MDFIKGVQLDQDQHSRYFYILHEEQLPDEQLEQPLLPSRVRTRLPL